MAQLSPLFTWRTALADSDLTAVARHVALALSIHMNERGDSCFPSIETLRRETGYGSKSTVLRALAELERHGWLTVKREQMRLTGGGPGRAKSNRYSATIPDVKGTPSEPLFEPNDTSVKGSPDEKKGSPDARKGTPPIPEDVLERKEDVKPSARAREADLFAEFWKLYPERDGKKLAKGKAEAVFHKTPKRERRALFVGVRHYAAACQSGITKAKDAHRWLRDRDWLDWQTPAEPDPDRRRKTPNEQAFDDFTKDEEWRAAFDDFNGGGKAGPVSQGRLPAGPVEPGPDEDLHARNGGPRRDGGRDGDPGMGTSSRVPAVNRRYTP